MNDSKKEEFFKHEGIPRRAKALMHTMYSRDTDEINLRLKESNISIFEFAKSVYEGYESTRMKTNSSLNYYCWILSFKIKSKPSRYFKNWYLIYRHFCIRSRIDPSDLVGLDYKMLRYIAESGQEIMSEDVTKQAVERLSELSQDYNKKWKYIRDLKEMRKDFFKMKNKEDFVRKWFLSDVM